MTTTVTQPEPVDAEVTEITETALAVRPSSEVGEWMPRFAASVDEMIALVNEKQRFMQSVMREEVHYGKIPGTGERKVLLKPGAELLLSSMGMSAELTNSADPILDFTGKDHNGEAFVMYQRACSISRYDRQTGERVLVARAEGSANSWEVKYRYRTAGRECPDCGKATIKESGFEDSKGDFYCHAKSGGCGHKFKKNTPAWTALKAVEVGRIPNPDVAEVANTLLKMADKRALVAATLIATGFSQDFTQDVEEKLGRGTDDITDPPHPDDGQDWGGYGGTAEPAPRPAAPVAPGTKVLGPDGKVYDDMDPAGPGPTPVQPVATDVDPASIPANVGMEPENGASQTASTEASQPVTTPPPASQPTASNGQQGASVEDVRKRQIDTLNHLADDLPPAAMFNRIKVKALLGKTGETPESVLGQLMAAHQKFHDGVCTHIDAATAAWPA